MRTKKIDRFQGILLLIILLYSIFVSVKNPAFIHIETIFDIIRVASTTLMVAMGLLVVMISGGIDVSFMSIALFGSYTTIHIMISMGIDNLIFAFGISALIGGLLGITNALLINWLIFVNIGSKALIALFFIMVTIWLNVIGMDSNCWLMLSVAANIAFFTMSEDNSPSDAISRIEPIGTCI